MCGEENGETLSTRKQRSYFFLTLSLSLTVTDDAFRINDVCSPDVVTVRMHASVMFSDGFVHVGE